MIVTVDRNNQLNGLLRGQVHVTAQDGQAATIEVVATVGEPGPIAETISVVAIDPTTGEIVARFETSEELSFEYSFVDLEPGSYLLAAGTDRNDNGIICELGDLCGAWPILILRLPVTVNAGDQLTGRDFTVTRRLLRRVQQSQNN